MSADYTIYPGWELDGLHVSSLDVFERDEHFMLLNPEIGTTLFIDRDLMRHFEHKKIPKELAFLMVQRGLATYSHSRSVSKIEHPANPHFFMLDLTKRCNLSCKYCFRALDEQGESMTDEMLMNICEKLYSYWKRHPEIQLYIQAWGGEPLLRVDQILSIRSFFKEKGLHPTIDVETNGTLIDDVMAQQLKESDIHVGISIDGDAILQNNQRPFKNGKPTSERLSSALSSLHKFYGDKFGSITVITRGTMARLSEIMDYFVNTLHLYSMKFNPLRNAGDYDQLSLTDDELISFEENLFHEVFNYIKAGKKCREKNILQKLHNLVNRPCDNICNSRGCQGGYAMLTIDAQGDVYPCELTDFADYRIGNINNQTIEEMVRCAANGGNSYFEERTFERCDQCPWLFYCHGGCKSAAIFAKRNLQTIDETECLVNRTIYPLLVDLLLRDPELAQTALIQ